MTDKELRRMSRVDLVEIIYQYQNREQEQQRRIEELTARLQDRRSHLENVGSIAEAALAVNHIFEAAQTAADQYLDEVRELNRETKKQAENILKEANQEADRIREKASKLMEDRGKS